MFGHFLNPSHAPPALLEDQSVGGYPKIGVVALVKQQYMRPDGTLMIEYEGSRRVQLLSVSTDEEPYVVSSMYSC